MLGAFGEVTGVDGVEEIRELEFRVAAQRMYPQWLSDLRKDTESDIFQAQGTYIVANNDGVDDRASINRMKAEADRLGEPAEWREPNQVPGLTPSPGHGPSKCLYLANEHSLDSAQLLDALNEACRRSPAYKHVDDSVCTVIPVDSRWKITTKSGFELLVDQVVVAAGARTNSVLSKETIDAAGMPDLYFGKGISVLVSGAPHVAQTIRTPNRAFACGIHVVPRNEQELLYIGATNFLVTDYELEKGMQPGELHALFDDSIHQINTGIRVSRIEAFRVGFRPIASHRRPLLGRTKLAGLFIATGTYRNGVLMAPLVGKILAQELGFSETNYRNPFPVEPVTENFFDQKMHTLTEVGVRDIVSFLHEPRGRLPYNRAEQLEKYIRVLFELSVSDDEQHQALRQKIRSRLRQAPFNETMHQLFYEIVETAGTD